MPIVIYKDDESIEELASLCDESWNLAYQVEILEEWILKNDFKFKKNKYAVDIGFKVREEASGGGAFISNSFMKKMFELGIELYLSEYS